MRTALDTGMTTFARDHQGRRASAVKGDFGSLLDAERAPSMRDHGTAMETREEPKPGLAVPGSSDHGAAGARSDGDASRSGKVAPRPPAVTSPATMTMRGLQDETPDSLPTDPAAGGASTPRDDGADIESRPVDALASESGPTAVPEPGSQIPATKDVTEPFREARQNSARSAPDIRSESASVGVGGEIVRFTHDVETTSARPAETTSKLSEKPAHASSLPERRAPPSSSAEPFDGNPARTASIVTGKRDPEISRGASDTNELAPATASSAPSALRLSDPDEVEDNMRPSQNMHTDTAFVRRSVRRADHDAAPTTSSGRPQARLSTGTPSEPLHHAVVIAEPKSQADVMSMRTEVAAEVPSARQQPAKGTEADEAGERQHVAPQALPAPFRIEAANQPLPASATAERVEMARLSRPSIGSADAGSTAAGRTTTIAAKVGKETAPPQGRTYGGQPMQELGRFAVEPMTKIQPQPVHDDISANTQPLPVASPGDVPPAEGRPQAPDRFENVLPASDRAQSASSDVAAPTVSIPVASPGDVSEWRPRAPDQLQTTEPASNRTPPGSASPDVNAPTLLLPVASPSDVLSVEGSQAPDRLETAPPASNRARPVSSYVDAPVISSPVASPGDVSEWRPRAPDQLGTAEPASNRTPPAASPDVDAPSLPLPVASASDVLSVERPQAPDRLETAPPAFNRARPVSSDVDAPIISSPVASPSDVLHVSRPRAPDRSETAPPASSRARPVSSDVDAPTVPLPVASPSEVPSVERPQAADRLETAPPASDRARLVSSDAAVPTLPIPFASAGEVPSVEETMRATGGLEKKPLASSGAQPVHGAVSSGADAPTSHSIANPPAESPAPAARVGNVSQATDALPVNRRVSAWHSEPPATKPRPDEARSAAVTMGRSDNSGPVPAISSSGIARNPASPELEEKSGGLDRSPDSPARRPQSRPSPVAISTVPPAVDRDLARGNPLATMQSVTVPRSPDAAIPATPAAARTPRLFASTDTPTNAPALLSDDIPDNHASTLSITRGEASTTEASAQTPRGGVVAAPIQAPPQSIEHSAPTSTADGPSNFAAQVTVAAAKYAVQTSRQDTGEAPPPTLPAMSPALFFTDKTLAPPSPGDTLASAIAAEPSWRPAAVAATTQPPAVRPQILQIQLNPDHLGTVTATLTLSGTQLVVELAASTREAHERLKGEEQVIEKAMRALGYDVGQVSITQSIVAGSAVSRPDATPAVPQSLQRDQASGGGAMSSGDGQPRDQRGGRNGNDGSGSYSGSSPRDPDRRRGGVYI